MRVSARGEGFWGYLSLFTSISTLLCCALPSLFVLVGLGATVASVVSAVPWLIAFSRHKNWTFAIAGLLIAANFIYVFRFAPRLRADSQSCPVDGPSACGTASRVSRWILWVSAGIYIKALKIASDQRIELLRQECNENQAGVFVWM